MATWHELARENRAAAFELFETRRWRSCVSRVYYTIYSESTQALLDAGLSMPRAKPDPSHRDLPMLLGTNLHSLSMGRRWRLAGIVETAYALRIYADYVPPATIVSDDATIAMGLMSQALILLELRE